MRLAAAASMVLVVAVALTATGCVAERTLPPGPTADELDAYYSQRVDDAWANTGLEGIVERPVIEIAGFDGDGGSNGDLGQCLVDRGYDSFGYSDGDNGVEFVTVDGSTLTPKMQLDFYSCFAESPAPFGMSQVMMSPAQLEFLYDYYQQWVIPCLSSVGMSVSDVPSRERYLADPFGRWTPYAALVDVDALTERCGEPYAGILPERAAPVDPRTALVQPGNG